MRSVRIAMLILVFGVVARLVLLPIAPAMPAPAAAGVDLLTYRGDAARTGWNDAEQILTPAAVHSGAFGRRWTSTVDGEVYAQPLVAHGVSVAGASRTLVFVVTERDLVYAFDAANGNRVWGPVSLGAPVRRASLLCGNIDPVGITSTPAIDRASSTLYVAGLTTPDNGRTKIYKMAAIDLATGAIRAGWPVAIAPPASSGIQFNPAAQQQRGALLLLRGIVYVPFGGYFGDCGEYHGWVVGIPTAQPSRQQAFVTPTHRAGGIWTAVAADEAGNLYASTGNSFDFSGTVDFGESVVRLTTAPTLAFSGRSVDFFTPSNFVALNESDTDLGSSTPLVLPSQPGLATPDLIFIAGKQGVGYLINRANMGGLSRGDGVTGEAAFSGCLFGTCSDRGAGVFAAAAYWDAGTAGRFIAVPGHGNQPAPCHGTGGVVALRLGAAATTRAAAFSVAWCGPSMIDAGPPTVSSAGTAGGVVWVVDSGARTLNALDAKTGEQIYVTGAGDVLGSARRFISPTVVDGRVFVGISKSVDSFGLK
ncbi:MAG TPA: PQQ-binding-like beta-propeller repeat protein [bacterium]|nr:PQQ-binding-like beta-propeller repeat protein [bacterium]